MIPFTPNQTDSHRYHDSYHYTGGRFVAVGNGVAVYSNDGLTWSSATLGASESGGTWKSVCWSPDLGMYAACGSNTNNEVLMTSPDGITWTARAITVGSPPPAGTVTSLSKITWGNGMFIASCVGTGKYATSPDGLVWTSRNHAGLNPYNCIAYSPTLNMWAAGANDTNKILTSTTGTSSWVTQSVPTSELFDIIWVDDLAKFIAVGNSNVVYSSNGTTWTVLGAVVTSHSAPGCASIRWSPNIGLLEFITSSHNNPRVLATSPNGITWTENPIGVNLQLENNNTPPSMCWSHDTTGGDGRHIFVCAPAYSANYLTISTGGIEWTRIYLPTTMTLNAVEWGNPS